MQHFCVKRAGGIRDCLRHITIKVPLWKGDLDEKAIGEDPYFCRVPSCWVAWAAYLALEVSFL